MPLQGKKKRNTHTGLQWQQSSVQAAEYTAKAETDQTELDKATAEREKEKAFSLVYQTMVAPRLHLSCSGC